MLLVIPSPTRLLVQLYGLAESSRLSQRNLLRQLKERDQFYKSMRFRGVVTGAVTNLKARGIVHSVNRDLDAAKFRLGQAFRRVIGKQILGSQFIADLTKSPVQLGN